MKTIYHLRPCYGRNPRTGKQVGQRHRWDIGNQCIWCGRFREDLLVEFKPKPLKST